MTFQLLHLSDIDPDWDRSGRWRLGAALGTPGGMTVPVQAIYVHHTVSADTGDVVRDVAGPCDTDQHNFGKLSYSWNIHESSSSVIEVEGTHRGAHTINNAQQSLNGVSFGFGVIGNFHPSAPNPTPRRPSDALIELVAAAIFDRAIKPGYAHADTPILGHRDAPYATACCGDWLYARLGDIRAAVARLLAAPLMPQVATSGQGGPMVNLYHPFDPYRNDEVWIGPHDDPNVPAEFGPVMHRFYTKDGWTNPEKLGGQAKAVSASWKHDGSQFRIVAVGTDGAYEDVFDLSTGKWRGFVKLSVALHP